MNGKIYKIVTAHSNEIYIGSTINSLEYRLYSHKLMDGLIENLKKVTVHHMKF